MAKRPGPVEIQQSHELPDCQRLLRDLGQIRVLWIWCPTAHSKQRLIDGLAADGWSVSNMLDLSLSVVISEHTLLRFAEVLETFLTPQELVLTKMVGTPDSHLGPEHLGQFQTAQAFAARCKARWVFRLLADDQYATWYQPLVAAQPGPGGRQTVFGHEALFRLNREGAAVSPQRLFETAAQAGLCSALDLFARRSALRHVGTLARQGPIFINFDLCGFADPDHGLRSTLALMAELGLTPDQIVFEVTESAVPGESAHLVSVLQAYRQAGFRIALDDVGAEYSGLTLLQALRPEFIKIDKALIKDIARDRYRQNLVTHLIQAGRANGVTVVAEGVETAEDCNWLIAHQADLLQGFLFGHPAPQIQTPLPEAQPAKLSFGTDWIDAFGAVHGPDMIVV
ncbi:MAG: EAL domain-containing protein [Rhodospirillaceae bacterium]